MPYFTSRARLNEIIFGTDTPAGKLFDVALIVTILLSVGVLMLDTVQVSDARYHGYLYLAEWVFTVIFTIEYVARIYCSSNRKKYLTSLYGITDLLAILPTYVSLLFPGAQYLLVVRLIRVLRVFRVLKLVRYLNEANVLVRAILMTRRKIAVFFVFVLVLATVFGALMYVVEGPNEGFSSIPKSIYWTIVTITTVGYGDIIPTTPVGQFIAALAMLTGYSIIAVPTGILTAELAQEMQRERVSRTCQNCHRQGHDIDADFCKFCGSKL